MPQPIDPQTELGRITAAERIQQISDRASLAAQQRVAEDTDKQQRLLEQEVQETHQKNKEVETETKRRNPFMGRRKKKKKSSDDSTHTLYNENENKEIVEDPDDHTLDITI